MQVFAHSRNGDLSENHHFISNDVGMTIPLFLLELEESVCESRMGRKAKSMSVCSGYLVGRRLFLILCIACSSYCFPQGLVVPTLTRAGVLSLHKLVYLPLRPLTAYAGNEGAEAKASPRLC